MALAAMSLISVKAEERGGKARELLAFLKENLMSVLLWPLAALVLGTAGWIYFLSALDEKEQQAEKNILNRTAAFAANYADRTRRSIDGFDLLLRVMRRNWAISKGAIKLVETGEQNLLTSDSVVAIAIFDGTGRMITSSKPDGQPFSAQNSLYFTEQRDSNADLLYISPPLLDRISDREVVVFSRKLESAADRFPGIVALFVLPQYFTANYIETILGSHGILSLLGTENNFQIARTGNRMYTTSMPLLNAFSSSDSNRKTYARGEHWFSDKRNRYISWQPVKGYPLLAAVGFDAQEAKAGFLLEKNKSLSNALWNTLWLAGAALLGMAFSILHSWRRYQLDLIRTAYRIATEDSGDGFFIKRPIRNLKGEISDFEIVDCNHRGAELLGTSRNLIVGRKLSDVLDGSSLNQLSQQLHDALEHGLHESEIQTSGKAPFKAHWLRFKAVRTQGDLAITIRDISESKMHVQELERRSNEDSLTGLPNRFWIQSYLPKAIDRAQQSKNDLAVLFIDLDGFKAINDALGHLAGDELLRTVSKRLRAAVRPLDHVVRLGGDEFVVLVENLSQEDDVQYIAERVLKAFRAGFHTHYGVYAVGASIGISLYPMDGDDALTLLKNADIAMYWVKTSGKGGYRFFQPHFYEAVRTKLDRQMELRNAVELDQFVMHYQPRVDLAKGRTSSMEALVRWEHPTRGLIEPNEFIPLAEETSLILRLGELVIDKVCSQMRQWAIDGQPLVPVSVNVSPRQFDQSNLPAILETAVMRHGIDASLLEMEVTESSMMRGDSEDADATGIIGRMRKMGVKLCIDDFGTGYSSLAQLQKLQFDVLKIDRAFVSKILQPEGQALIVSIITMAHALGMRVVAEGVENKGQLNILEELGCDEAQGYYISKPIPPSDRQPVTPKSFLPELSL